MRPDEFVKPAAMLLACTACHRQYDVGDHAPGSKVRCSCGKLILVTRPVPRQVEMFHCATCGGNLAQGESRCSYCAAEVRLGARGLGPACPRCFATTLLDAQHCSTCGVALRAEATLRPLAGRTCPRCKSELSECENERMRYVECTACGGLWLDETLFERVVEERRSVVAEVLPHEREKATASPARETKVAYLPCPVCGETMHRRGFGEGSGVVLDWCRGHGWWFDSEELARVLEFVEAGGLERARERLDARRRYELDRLERKKRETRIGTAPAAPLERELGSPRPLPDFLRFVADMLDLLW